ncbi:ABC transporter ATP-binding protein [Candidatus Kaiserbacteria bacterium]|nr:ABC transporter ATP-binding protein [Candidatus Kaiserbacteria bacterium]
MESIWRDDYNGGKNPLRFFLFVSRPHATSMITAIGLATLADVFSGSVSYIFKLIANAAAALPHGGSYDALFWPSVGAILILGFAKLFWRIAGRAAARWATGAQATARYALTSYVTLHSRSYFSDRFAGSIMTKIRHAAAGSREIVDMFLWEFLELAVNAVVSFIIALLVSPLIAGIFFIWIAAMVALNAYLGWKRVPLATAAHNLETALNGATVDLLTNVSAMQEYAQRGYEIDRLKAATEMRRVAGLRSWYFGEWTRALNSVFLVIFGSAMMLTTVTLAKTGAIGVGDIILVITIIFRIEGLLQSLGSNFNKFSETWGEIQESLDEIIEPHEIPDAEGASALVVSEGEIILNDVSFGYAGNSVFEHLNLKVMPGERLGLVGRSGAGKSTLFRLMLHHHDLASGTIRIDGQDISQVTQESLRGAIAVVPQEPLLFHRSIKENIAYGNPEASTEAVERAAKLAFAHEFIERLPEGYESLVGERGVKLSGGERQRIAISRAILKDAPILLLDEATSALDSESEVIIQRALHRLMEGKTVIAIAHRLSTLREMNRIIVLDRGAITQEGTHDELLAQGGIYAELWKHQAGGFLQDE